MTRIALIAAAISVCAHSQTWHYEGEWRLMTAGTVEVNWSAGAASMSIRTTGFVASLYKVDDRYKISHDPQLCAVASEMLAHEGNRKRETKVSYRSQPGKAEYLERDLIAGRIVRQSDLDVPACVHDTLAGLAKLRTIRLAPGAETALPISDGRKSARVRIRADKKETVRTPLGVFSCIRHEVFLLNDVIYRRKGKLFVWLSDDDRRLPVQIRVQMPFYLGTVTLQLIKEQGG